MYTSEFQPEYLKQFKPQNQHRSCCCGSGTPEPPLKKVVKKACYLRYEISCSVPKAGS